MEGSWKKFYTERKGKYKSKFPFLKEDQITAKLKRIWDRERSIGWVDCASDRFHFDLGGTRLTFFINCGIIGGLTNTHKTTNWRTSPVKKPASLANGGFCFPATEKELCQENVAPCLDSPHWPTSSPALMLSSNKGAGTCTTPSSPPSHPTPSATNHPPPDTTPTDSDTSRGYSEGEDEEGFLCAMFAPLPVKMNQCGAGPVSPTTSHQHATPPTASYSTVSERNGNKYCLFLNEDDIFM